MQGASFAFQAYQVMRYGALMVAAVGMAWLQAPKRLIDDYETLLLIGGSTTFFWVGGLLDGFLLLQKKSDPLRTSAIQTAIRPIGFGLALASAIVCALIAVIFYSSLDIFAVLGFAAFVFLETASQILPYHFIAADRGRQLLYYGAISSLGYCFAIFIPLLLGWGLVPMVFLLAILALIKTAWMLASMWEPRENRSIDSAILSELWKISWPLVLATLLSQGTVYVDSFLVQRFFPDQFIDFRYGAKEFPLVLLLANSMSIVRAGEIASGLRDNRLDAGFQGLKSGTSRLVLTMMPLSMLLMVFSGPLFTAFFAGRFPMAMPVFDLFLLLAIPRLMFPQSVIRGFQATKIMSISAGVEMVINVVLSLILMQWFGIAGIAAGTVIAFMVEKGILLGYTQFKLGIAWHRYASVPLWLAGTLLIIVVWIAKYLLLPSLGW